MAAPLGLDQRLQWLGWGSDRPTHAELALAPNTHWGSLGPFIISLLSSTQAKDSGYSSELVPVATTPGNGLHGAALRKPPKSWGVPQNCLRNVRYPKISSVMWAIQKLTQ